MHAIGYLDRSVFPRLDRPQEMEVARRILELRARGLSIAAITETLNAMRIRGSRAWHGHWNARLVGSVVRRLGGRRRGRKHYL